MRVSGKYVLCGGWGQVRVSRKYVLCGGWGQVRVSRKYVLCGGWGQVREYLESISVWRLGSSERVSRK